MFPFVKKHLYIGQDVDGYAVVTMNSTYTGGLMISPLINPGSYVENYADTLTTLSSYNSGGSVVISTGGGTTTTSFTDWTLPSKDDWMEMVGFIQTSQLLSSGQIVWTSTDGDLDPSNNKYCVEYPSGTYLYIEYDKTTEKSVRFVRNFTL